MGFGRQSSEERTDGSFTITIDRRTLRIAFYIGVGILALYAVKTHNENLMWRETAGRILSLTNPR